MLMQPEEVAVVGRFATNPDHITLAFRHLAGEYWVRVDNPNLARIVAALAESWSKKTPMHFQTDGNEVVDAVQEPR